MITSHFDQYKELVQIIQQDTEPVYNICIKVICCLIEQVLESLIEQVLEIISFIVIFHHHNHVHEGLDMFPVP